MNCHAYLLRYLAHCDQTRGCHLQPVTCNLLDARRLLHLTLRPAVPFVSALETRQTTGERRALALRLVVHVCVSACCLGAVALRLQRAHLPPSCSLGGLICSDQIGRLFLMTSGPIQFLSCPPPPASSPLVCSLTWSKPHWAIRGPPAAEASSPRTHHLGRRMPPIRPNASRKLTLA